MTAPLPQTLKEEAQADLAAIYEQVMLRVKSLPRVDEPGGDIPPAERK